MATHIAVIDLGTNTFHLLIVKIKENRFTELYRERIFVNLAESGIQKIGLQAYYRAENAIVNLNSSLHNYSIDHCVVHGTEAMRTASNGPQLREKIESILGHSVQLIEGKKEAELIFKGTRLISNLTEGNHVIMDIGGGSTEFIITDQNKMVWSQSFPIGVTVLYNKFGGNDPLQKENTESLSNFLQDSLSSFLSAVKEYDIERLIGASGTFEVLQLSKEKKIIRHKTSFLSIGEFDSLFHQITSLDLANRLALHYVPTDRAKLLPVAFVLIDFIIKSIRPSLIEISPYAMKEGIISDYLG